MKGQLSLTHELRLHLRAEVDRAKRERLERAGDVEREAVMRARCFIATPEERAEGRRRAQQRYRQRNQERITQLKRDYRARQRREAA